MRAGNVILWRHGQTDYNATGRLQGQVDIPLNETGATQAEEAAVLLRMLRPTAIVSSDLRRAVQTAEPLAAHFGLPIHEDQRMRERSFGVWEGLTRDEINAQWPGAYEQWRKGEHPEGVDAESRGELGARFAEGVNEWAAKFETSDTLVIVTHGAAISTGITALLGLDTEQWRGISGISNCHWSVLEPYRGAPGWRLMRHNTLTG